MGYPAHYAKVSQMQTIGLPDTFEAVKKLQGRKNPVVADYRKTDREIVEKHGAATLSRVAKELNAHGDVITAHGDEFYTPGHLYRFRKELTGIRIPYSETITRIVNGKLVTGKITRQGNPRKISKKTVKATGIGLGTLAAITIAGIAIWRWGTRKAE